MIFMGLLNRLLGKKEKTKEPVENEPGDPTELTEEALEEVCGHIPREVWCPPAKVEPIIDIGGRKKLQLAQENKMV